MNYSILNPTVNHTVIVNTYNDPAGLLRAANSSMIQFGGLWWAIFDGSRIGFGESQSDQSIWCKHAPTTAQMETGLTVATGLAHRPFGDATYCTNPIVSTTVQWQPSFVNIQGTLCALWTGTDAFISKYDSIAAQWTNYRFEFSGTSVFISSTAEGSPQAGHAVRPTFNDPSGTSRSNWLPYSTQNPVQLSSGVIACPLIMETNTASSQLTGAASFTEAIKVAVLFLTTDGVNWSMSAPINTGALNTGGYGDFASWEPFVVEGGDGLLRVFIRNLSTVAQDADALLVATSSDGGNTFTQAVSTKMRLPSSRGFVTRLSTSRWAMAHCDMWMFSPCNPTQAIVFTQGRQNGTLFTSRHGIDDFIPGINWSSDWCLNYPQMVVGNDGNLYIHYHRGGASSSTDRNVLEVASLPLPDDAQTYVMPNSFAKFTALHRPNLVSGPPAYYNFDDLSEVVSTTSMTTSGGVTYAAWLELTDQPNVFIDSRQNGVPTAFGQVLTVQDITIGSLHLPHGFTPVWQTPFFIAATIDPTSQTITFSFGAGGVSTLQQKVCNFRSALLSANPADGDTVTIDGNVFTFRNAPTLTNDIQIGASAAATLSTLVTKLPTYSLQGTSGSGGVNRIICARSDMAAFTLTASSAVIAVETGFPLSGGLVYFGHEIPSSSLKAFRGQLYEGRVFASAVSQSNVDFLYNARAASFGYSTLTDAGTDPGTPLIVLDATNPDTTQFPGLLVDYPRCEVISSTLRLHGEASAGVELPYNVTDVVLSYKLAVAPTGTDKYVLATLGRLDYTARLYIDATNPTEIYCNGRFVANVTDPTTWSTLTIRVFNDKFQVSGFEFYAAGRPRLHLGSAYPEGLLSAAKTYDFDTSVMTATKVA